MRRLGAKPPYGEQGGAYDFPNPFEIEVPGNLRAGSHQLRIESDAWFVPSEISDSPDARRLFIRLLGWESR